MYDGKKIILPGSIRSKKNSKQPLPIPCEKSTLYKKYSRAGIKPVRIILQPSKAYQEWEKAARAAFLAEFGRIDLIPKDTPIHVKAVAYIKGVAPDLSGMCESVGDCLEGFVWIDDRQIVSWDGSRVFRDKENPRTEIEVTVLNDHKETM
jgi:Holliday junction resolvase RusA-like endonuclease